MGRFKEEIIDHSISDCSNYGYEHGEFLFCEGQSKSLGESVQQLNDMWCFIFANQFNKVVLIFLNKIGSEPQIILEVHFVSEVTSILVNLNRRQGFNG